MNFIFGVLVGIAACAIYPDLPREVGHLLHLGAEWITAQTDPGGIVPSVTLEIGEKLNGN